MTSAGEATKLPKGRSPHALLVDDNADVRFLARCLLEGVGFDVSEVESGAAALELLTGELPDVVLLDIQMPEMDGWETLQAIRDNPETADLAVVLWTVKGRPEDVVRGWELGCDGYLPKPFDMVQLQSEVRRVISPGIAERMRSRSARLTVAREHLAATNS